MSALETVKAAYAGFARNDPSGLFGAMDPGIKWYEAEGFSLAKRNPYVGPQAIGEGVFGPIMAGIDHFTVTPSSYIDGGDQVVAFGRYGGTAKDDGSKFDAPFCHVYQFRDGKIVTFQQFTDTIQWARVLG